MLVIDNRSSDDTAGIVRRDFREVQLIANEENCGFAAAENQGITTAIQTLLLARVLSNDEMRQKAVRRLRSSAHFLGRYSGRLLFRT